MAEIQSNFDDVAFVSAFVSLLKDKSRKLHLLMIETIKNPITGEIIFPGLDSALSALMNEENSIVIVCSFNAEWYFTRNKDRKIQAKFNSIRRSNRVGFVLLPARLKFFVDLYEKLIL